MSKALAIKYRPAKFEDVTEQGSIVSILKYQLATNTTKNAYLFCGGAGTGKTTCARIFANEINKQKGNPIEMDAASNSSVDDVRHIIEQARTKSIDSEYKVFIIDECHAISQTGWQAFLKLIEEPPAKSIFIFCTTDPQKIPKTILSRVQRYDFQRISNTGVVSRLKYILDAEGTYKYDTDAIEYISKLADGGMRDAITLMDKCLSYNPELSVKSITEALGTADYAELCRFVQAIACCGHKDIIEIVNAVHMSGRDLKQFIHQAMQYTLDICTYKIYGNLKYASVPETCIDDFNGFIDYEADYSKILGDLVKLNASIKWEQMPKAVIIATLIMR